MFQTLTGDVQGPLEVRSLVKVDGTVNGGVIVTGGRLELDGTCRGPLEVRLDGQAEVHGIVEGDVHARGGRLRLSGVVKGKLGVKEGADVLVAVGTVLNGRQLLPDGSFPHCPVPVSTTSPRTPRCCAPTRAAPGRRRSEPAAALTPSTRRRERRLRTGRVPSAQRRTARPSPRAPTALKATTNAVSVGSS